MRSVARIQNSKGEHRLEVTMGAHTAAISIAPKASGFGSSVSGGEMLMAALATCYCNDVYREAQRLGIEVLSVEVECSAEFPAEGAPASDVSYSSQIRAKASEARIRELAERTDQMAEIHNSLRTTIPVRLERVEPIEAPGNADLGEERE